ncbi:MAG: hypothetical protein Fur0018_17240 [Anaerolineales bacterium]
MLALVTIPYLVAWRAAGRAYVFSGLLFNPLDGASYLAKMRQGWEGAWRYRLAFSAGAQDEAFLFLYYLFLGHAARWLGLSLPVMYHLARLGGMIALLYALDAFFAAYLPAESRQKAFALAVLGSGMGWLALPAGAFPADFWVAEAYPFLSAFANPHFPLSLALMLTLLLPVPNENALWLRRTGCALFLALMSPFGMVLVILLETARTLWEGRGTPWRQITLKGVRSLLPLGVGGLPYLLYTQWVVASFPSFAAWNAQNQTPALPVWDTLLSFAPLWIFALYGLRHRRDRTPPASLLTIWSALAFFLLYLPLPLQRRFLLGWYIPLAALSAWALSGQRGQRLWRLGFLLALPTNLILLLAVLGGALRHAPEIYLTRAEVQALAWLEANTPPDSVVLASPEMSTFIPGWSNRRVVYAHPYESVPASAEDAVLRWFAGQATLADRERLAAADYIFLGVRERALGAASPLPAPVYRNAEVAIYPYLP